MRASVALQALYEQCSLCLVAKPLQREDLSQKAFWILLLVFGALKVKIFSQE